MCTCIKSTGVISSVAALTGTQQKKKTSWLVLDWSQQRENEENEKTGQVKKYPGDRSQEEVRRSDQLKYILKTRALDNILIKIGRHQQKP